MSNLTTVLANKLLLLHCIREINLRKKGAATSFLINRVAFVVQWLASELEQDLWGFSFYFVRFPYGPYSKFLAETLLNLNHDGYLIKPHIGYSEYQLSDMGHSLLDGWPLESVIAEEVCLTLHHAIDHLIRVRYEDISQIVTRLTGVEMADYLMGHPIIVPGSRTYVREAEEKEYIAELESLFNIFGK